MNKEELLKIAKPILFNQEMVQAILDNRKSTTREYEEVFFMKHSRYQAGDILYVREAFCEIPYVYENIPIKDGYITVPKIAYRADSEVDYTGIWKPSTNMPKELARIFLKVTNVRVERLQDITEEQAIKEGFNSREEFIKAILEMYPEVTEDNWMWVIEFERIEVE